MKHGVKLTRKQKVLLSSKKLNPDDWLAVENTSKKLGIINKKSRKVFYLYLERRRDKED